MAKRTKKQFNNSESSSILNSIKVSRGEASGELAEDQGASLFLTVDPSSGTARRNKSANGNHNTPLDDGLSDDQKAVRDYFRNVSQMMDDMMAITNSAQDGHRMGGEFIERQLTPKLAALGKGMLEHQRTFFKKVAESKSDFFTDQVKLDAKASVEAIANELSQGDSNAMAAGLRQLFSRTSQYFMRSPMPSIPVWTYASFEELLKAHDYCKLERFFAPYSSSSDNPNGRMRCESDHRGEFDINLPFYLHFLPVTPYLKETLIRYGVSEELVNCLGNYRVSDSVATAEFTSSSFIDDSKMLGVQPFRRYGGPTYCKEIVDDLLSFITKTRAKSVHIMSPSGGLDSNLINPDLAVKLWIQSAFNAIFKVMVEDAAGAMERVGASIAYNTSNAIPAFVPDVMCLSANSNKWFFDEMVDDSSKFITSGKVRYNQKVYDFIKARWAPIISTFKSTVTRFIDKEQVPNREYSVRLIPELVLPCNPYDSASAHYESHVNTKGALNSVEVMDVGTKEDELTSRTLMYRPIKLPEAYVSVRTGQHHSAITLHFDNYLSRSLYIIANPKIYNGHSYRAIPWNEDDNVVDDSKNLTTSYASYSSAKVNGPHVRSASDKFAVSLIASGLDYYAYTGSLYTDRGTAIDPVLCTDITFSSGNPSLSNQPSDDAPDTDDESDVTESYASSAARVSRCLEYHTNPTCIRMLSICQWYNQNGPFLAISGHWTDSFNRFLTGVVRTDAAYAQTLSKSMNKPVFKGDARLVGGLSAADFFRYSVVYDGVGSSFLIDNTTVLAPSPKIIRSVSRSASAANRQMTYYLTNAARPGAETEDKMRASHATVSGALNDIKGTNVKECSRLGDAMGVYAWAGPDTANSTTSIPSLYDTCSQLSYPCARFITDKPAFRLPWTYTKVSGNQVYISYSRTMRWGVFTKRVDMTSISMRNSSTAPTENSPHLLLQTPIASRFTWARAMKRWAQNLKDWNALINIHGQSNYGTIEFDKAVDRIFAPFSQALFDPYTVYISTSAEAGDINVIRGKTNVDNLRYSCSSCVSILSSGSSNHASSPICGYVGVNNYSNITSVGAVIGPWVKSDPDATAQVMKVCGQKVLPQLSNVSYTHITKPAHGLVVKLNPSVVARDEYKEAYAAFLPKDASNTGEVGFPFSPDNAGSYSV